MLRRKAIALAVLLLSLSPQAWAAEPTRTKVTFTPDAREADVPEFYRQTAHTFSYAERLRPNRLEGLQISDITFPSPIETPHEANNTVHCEYFRAREPGRRPAVVVLHILGGDFELSRMCCRAIAARGTHALFLKLPYYGPRRQPGVNVRMISPDIDQTVRGMQQGVYDVRRAATLLASRPEVDPERIGITGISLGGIVGALAAAVEPQFDRACLLLAGGDIARVAWESPELARLRKFWQQEGITRAAAVDRLREIDPVTHAPRLIGRRVLMLNAKYDKVVPPACTKSLWEAAGKPEIQWWDAGHYSAAIYLPVGLLKMSAFFAADGPLPAAVQ